MIEPSGNRVLLAIYIDPPVDVKSVPQNYTIHCITTSSNINVKMFLESHGNSYYNNQIPPVLGYNETPPLLMSTSGTCHYYSEEVVWQANSVVTDSTDFSEEGLTKYNGDHDWSCQVETHNNYLQTYIRGTLHACSIV